ncbi:MAG: deoxyribodipyrimidine photolyase [Myxococcales bacterium]|nr:deoxyribodipyrimidine photolyase [Myxococcales bacterium]
MPESRIHGFNQKEWNPEGDFVLYWMVAARRSRWNFALDRAIEQAQRLQKPLVIFEALRCGYDWASDRHHRFVMDGMVDQAKAFAQTPATYVAYVEREHGEGRGLLEALSQRSCGVITDLFPAFFLPRMLRAVAPRLAVPLEAIDSNGLLPLRAADRVFTTAYSFRRFLHKTLSPFLLEWPSSSPWEGVTLPRLQSFPAEIRKKWPVFVGAEFVGDAVDISRLPIDHRVSAVKETQGGEQAAQQQMQGFLKFRLRRYAEERNEPEEEVASGFSPYLHFGHLSTHEVFSKIVEREGWEPHRLGKPTGQRGGWWGMSEVAEAFLDELVTWREIGFNMAFLDEHYEEYASLPGWAQETLEQHRSDPRSWEYTLKQFEQAQTHDPLWNAAQVQLVQEGKIHNYLRMLWGKKILEWSKSPEDALAVMIELNNKYALDGRDPNSYSGIFWVLGRYDRAWGPERPIFGKVRYMSSENTARKVQVKDYIARYTP